jgi:acyl-CoA reductase-like NAD-dependent aldehyde dehydrogenase
MLDKTRQDWSAEATGLAIEGRAFIGGRYRDALSGDTRTTMNPANGQKLVDLANCGAEDADHAVGIARGAFECGVWARMASADRKMVLVRWAELIEDHADEIALLESLDVGKPIPCQAGIDASQFRRPTVECSKCFSTIDRARS